MLVALGAGGSHRRPLAGIEQAELDSAGVRRPPHLRAQRIELANHLPLAEAPDSGVAGHPADGARIEGYQGRGRAHTRRGQGRLDPRVTATNDDHVKGIHTRVHDSPSPTTSSVPSAE